MKLFRYMRFCNACAMMLNINKKETNDEGKNLLLEQAGLPYLYQDYQNTRIITIMITCFLSLFVTFTLYFFYTPSLFLLIIPFLSILSIIVFFQILPEASWE